MTTNAQKNGRSMYCVPNALERILLYAYPADSVNCLPAQNHLRTAASKQLHYRLAVPHFGVLLITWPLGFGNDRRAGTFIWLLRRNLNRQLQDKQLLPIDKKVVAKTIETFLNGYEEIILHELCSNTHLYSALTTIVVDFSVYSGCLALFPGNFEYECAWEQWAHTINAVADECSSKLLRLYIVTNPEEEDEDLLADFYVALELDKILARTRNLQSLYMPSISDVGRAYDEISDREAWQALHNLSPEQRLPNLKRIVVESCYDLHLRSDTKSGLPLFPATNAVILDFYKDRLCKKEVVFPNARCLIAGESREGFVAHLFGLRGFGQSNMVIQRHRHPDVSFFGEKYNSSILAEQIVKYINDIRVPYYYGTNDALKCMRFARFGHSILSPTFYLVFNANHLSNTPTTMPMLIRLLQERILHARVRIDVRINDIGKWQRYKLLSFATAKGRITKLVIPLEFIHNFRLHLRLKWCSTLLEWIGDESEELLPSHVEFMLPQIVLSIEQVFEITCTPCQLYESHERLWVNQIDAEVKKCLQTFTRDAVAARSRRDFSFFMYQKLEAIRFRFDVRIRRQDRRFTSGSAGEGQSFRPTETRMSRIVDALSLHYHCALSEEESFHEGSVFYKSAFDGDLDLYFPTGDADKLENDAVLAALPGLKAAKVSFDIRLSNSEGQKGSKKFVFASE